MSSSLIVSWQPNYVPNDTARSSPRGAKKAHTRLLTTASRTTRHEKCQVSSRRNQFSSTFETRNQISSSFGMVCQILPKKSQKTYHSPTSTAKRTSKCCKTADSCCSAMHRALKHAAVGLGSMAQHRHMTEQHYKQPIPAAQSCAGRSSMLKRASDRWRSIAM